MRKAQALAELQSGYPFNQAFGHRAECFTECYPRRVSLQGLGARIATMASAPCSLDTSTSRLLVTSTPGAGNFNVQPGGLLPLSDSVVSSRSVISMQSRKHSANMAQHWPAGRVSLRTLLGFSSWIGYGSLHVPLPRANASEINWYGTLINGRLCKVPADRDFLLCWWRHPSTSTSFHGCGCLRLYRRAHGGQHSRVDRTRQGFPE